MKLQSLSGLTKAVIAFSAGGVLAGAIALGASGGGGGSSPPAQVVAQTPTSVPEHTAVPRPTPPNLASPNDIPADVQTLAEGTRKLAEAEGKGNRCPDSYVFYKSTLLGGSFCYPTSWSLVLGDRPLLPLNQRSQGYGAALVLTKLDSGGRELARVAIEVAGQPYTRTLTCPAPGVMQVGALQATACFRERRTHPLSTFGADVARVIFVSLPHKLDVLPETIASLQIAEQNPGRDVVSFSTADQLEGLEIIASIRFDP